MNERHFRNGDLTLVGDEHGERGRPPVLMLHGGGQTRSAWGPTAALLAAAGNHVVSLDMRGHGHSSWAPDGDYSQEAFISDVVLVAEELRAEGPGQPVALVGASMGGIVSLLALGEGHLEGRALVLVDIATRIEEAGTDRILAFMRAYPDGFATLAEAADHIASYQPHRPRPTRLDGLKKNLRQRDNGRWYWHWDPEFINPEGKAPRRAREPERLEQAARRLSLPTLLVRGRMSDVVSEQGARAFCEQVPHAHYVDVAGAAHMVAGDENDAFTAAVVDFIAGVD